MKKYILGCILLTTLALTSCGPSQVVVREKPVAPLYERPLAPASNYVWVDGTWIRNGNGYVYKQGYWSAPGARYKTYKSGYWRQTRRGYVWVPGRW